MDELKVPRAGRLVGTFGHHVDVDRHSCVPDGVILYARLVDNGIRVF